METELKCRNMKMERSMEDICLDFIQLLDRGTRIRAHTNTLGPLHLFSSARKSGRATGKQHEPSHQPRQPRTSLRLLAFLARVRPANSPSAIHRHVDPPFVHDTTRTLRLRDLRSDVLHTPAGSLSLNLDSVRKPLSDDIDASDATPLWLCRVDVLEDVLVAVAVGEA
jgi:hypothetical protein